MAYCPSGDALMKKPIVMIVLLAAVAACWYGWQHWRPQDRLRLQPGKAILAEDLDLPPMRNPQVVVQDLDFGRVGLEAAQAVLRECGAVCSPDALRHGRVSARR